MIVITMLTLVSGWPEAAIYIAGFLAAGYVLGEFFKAVCG